MCQRIELEWNGCCVRNPKRNFSASTNIRICEFVCVCVCKYEFVRANQIIFAKSFHLVALRCVWHSVDIFFPSVHRSHFALTHTLELAIKFLRYQK